MSHSNVMHKPSHGEGAVAWPRVDTAFLVVHGAGPHRPFEALDSFVRGFSGVLEGGQKSVRCHHRLRSREGWVQSYISLSRDGETAVLDFYEYYWDCYMVHGITIEELVDWLDRASSGARTFYAGMPELARQYEEMGVDLFKDGEFRDRGYLLLLASFSSLRRLFPLLRVCISLFYVPVLHTAIRGVLQWVSKKVLELGGDAVIYSTSDVRSRNYETRQRLLDGAIEEIRLLLEDDRYQRIVIAGHSLGSAIAYDALNRMALQMSVPNHDGVRQHAARLAGLVSFGSPLDKIAFFFEERTADEKCVQRQILNQLHGYRKVVSAKPEPSIHSPVQPVLDGLRWLNFYHVKDSIGGALDAYRVDLNMRCDIGVGGFSEAHACYWTWDGMYAEIAREFFQ